MKLFNEGRLCDVLEEQIRNLKAEIESQDKNYLLNANETLLIQHFIDKFRIIPLEIKADGVSASSREEMIPAERFPRFGFNVIGGKSYRKQVITYHLPFSGNKDLLRLAPSTRILWTQEVAVSNSEILFDLINWEDDAEAIRCNAESFLKSVQTQADNQAMEVKAFNGRLEDEVTRMITERKSDLLKKASLLASLGVPIKKAVDVPPTFAISTLKKRVIVPKPNASNLPFTPEPTLDKTIYQDILTIINDTGTEIERHPSLYEGKDEEPLRDNFLIMLSPHFSSVTGETFNKAGKTDLLIRHEGKNLFVAECAIWKGGKQFLGKIDQLLSYLTWRDSKAALICFVRNKEFGSVIETIKEVIPSHTNFVKEHPLISEAWLNYEFTLKDDPTRPVKVAILCFHFPGT